MMDSIQLRRLRKRMPLGSGSDSIPRAQLTIPKVPKFPLSSPITDEIASPSGTSSSEEDRDGGGNRDREVERSRPFELLSKNTKSRNPFMARFERGAAAGNENASVGETASKSASERMRVFEQSVAHTAEVHNPTSTSTSRERPVGLNLDIPGSITKPQAQTQAPAPPRKDTTGAFVDLNDLKNLSQAREEERTAQRLKGILKKGDGKRKDADTRGFARLQDDTEDIEPRRKRASLLDAASRTKKKTGAGALQHGISPTDRPIMIGFSVPRDSPELDNGYGGEKELDSAGTLHTPLTPSIIVTPAKEEGFWDHLSPEDAHTHTNTDTYANSNHHQRRPRAVSSIYSQPSPHLGLGPDVPPVPALPAFYSSGNDSNAYISAPGVSTENVRKRRSLSTGAMDEKASIEEEEDERIGRPRSRSIEKPKPHPSERLTINTALNARASQGWWNYLLSPLLSASSLFSPKTPKSRPTLPTISTNSSATGLTDEWWDEKQQWEKSESEKDKGMERSYFSPDTPEATRRISSWQTMTPGNITSNPFADFDWSIDEQNQMQNQDQNQASQDRDVASMMFSGAKIQGEAAEYYQACAHELFSGRPYFECESHVCSVTPKDMIPVAGSPQETDGQRGLLIDVDDVPRSNNLASPASGITSINSSPSDDAGRMPRNLRVSMNSRGAPSEGARGASPTLQPASPGPDHPTNPFEQEQPRGLSPPMSHAPPPALAPSNIHIESAPAPPPANIHIQAPAAQPAPNFHYEQPPAPVTLDAPAPYEASRGPMPASPAPFEAPRATPEPPTEPSRSRPIPAPISMPSPERTPPPNYGAQPHSPYPRSPESIEETTARGAVRLSHMPAGPAPAYTPHNHSDYPYPHHQSQNAELPHRITAMPVTRDALTHPIIAQDRIEARRQRYEREDAAAQQASSFWRGRGPISNKGCFGRVKTGREGRLRRRWYALICLFFIAIVVAAILLAVFLTRKGDGTPVQSQWLNLSGYPAMPTGISTIAGPEARVQESGCVQPTSMWSCALPKDQHGSNEPYDANQPNFRIEIRFQNGSYEHSTALVNGSVPTSSKSNATSNSNSTHESRSLGLSLLKRGANQLFNPSPEPPSVKEQAFLGRYTDNTSEPYAGEETPFYITVLSAEHLSSKTLHKRDTDTDKNTTTSNTTSSSDFGTGIQAKIPSPALDNDGTAAAATLYPLPSSQPVRLFNRGKKDEHYGFYTYFDKSIFLASESPLTDSKKNNQSDADGGSKKEEARTRCTFSQTRFLVQIWTNKNSGKNLLEQGFNATTTSKNSTSTTPSSTPTSSTSSTPSSSATDFEAPGSFPYPITITLDRHGGLRDKKMVYCYGMEGDQHVNATGGVITMENRGFAGNLVHAVPGLRGKDEDDDGKDGKDKDGEEYGGWDGGSGGCSCEWVNWVGSV